MEIKETIDREQQQQESPHPPLMDTTGTTDPNSDDLLVDASASLEPEQQQQQPQPSEDTLEDVPPSSSSSVLSELIQTPPVDQPPSNPRTVDPPQSDDLLVDAPASLESEQQQQQPQPSADTLEDSPSSSTSVLSDLFKTPPVDQPPSNPRTVDPPQPAALRRRRFSRFSADPVPRGRRNRILHDSPDPRPAADVDAVPEASSSTVTLDRMIVLGDEAVESPNEPLLCLIADFVIKVIFFQFNLLVFFFLVPFRLLQFSFSMAYDPFGTVKELMYAIKERFLWAWNGVMGKINPWVPETFGSRQGLGKLAMRFALGCFWSVYVGFILGGMLVTAFLGASSVMRQVVEEPLQIVRELNFDYTKPSPDALVAIDSRGSVHCPSLVSGGNYGFGKQLGSRAVPVNRRWQLVISLTLPESNYNRRLGVFQVRAEFLSESGKVTHSTSQPCMLQFKSLLIRFIETFLKTGTLLTGYSSESQILSAKMTGYIERNDPTVCIRVILEQRAEYNPGAGIPEIYAASLKLESQLSLLKRIIWNWRRTVFIWVAMTIFFFELLIVLVCCKPVIIPRTSPGGATPSSL